MNSNVIENIYCGRYDATFKDQPYEKTSKHAFPSKAS